MWDGCSRASPGWRGRVVALVSGIFHNHVLILVGWLWCRLLVARVDDITGRIHLRLLSFVQILSLGSRIPGLLGPCPRLPAHQAWSRHLHPLLGT